MPSTTVSATSGPPAGRALWVWTLGWMILAVLHVTQGIWLSRGGAWPGDLGDGRFNQLVLEHGYQSLRGVYAWDSPGQFYPAVRTLGFSDTHAGTLPVYAALRWAGCPMERAWQGWFVLVSALNFLACVWLLGALRVARVLHGPLGFAAVGAVTMVWFAGTHMQLLPVFAALFAWAQLARWAEDRAPWRLVAAGGWLIWQFCAAPYVAFFAVVIGGFAGALWWLPGFSTQRAARTAGGNSWPWVRVLVPTLGAVAVGAVVGRIYLTAVRGGAGRSLSEVIEFAPRLRDWFEAAPVSAVYARWWPYRGADITERALLAGFLPWFAVVVALGLAWRWRKTGEGRWLLVLSGGALGVALLFTTWSETGAGLWIALCRRVPALCAFRATGRVIGLLHVVQIAVVGLLLTAWLARAKTALARVLPVVLTMLVVGEGVAFHQPVVTIAEAKARMLALVTAWRANGDRPVLAYAPGYTNQSDAWINLDAWAAALALGRVTLNGYSGGQPGMHSTFLHNPTVDNARALIGGAGLSPEQVSVVESLGPVAEQALGLVRRRERAVSTLDGFDLQPAGWNLWFPLETFQLEGQVMYQFTPPAEVRFNLPDPVRQVDYRQALRPGAYTDTGHSDGVGLTWVVRQQDGGETVVWHEHFNPRDQPKDRGIVDRHLDLPAGQGRVLVLRVDYGPAGNGAWDWPVFGRLRCR